MPGEVSIHVIEACLYRSIRVEDDACQYHDIDDGVNIAVLPLNTPNPAPTLTAVLLNEILEVFKVNDG